MDKYLEFEQFFILGVGIVIFLFIFDSFSISKFVYFLLTRNKRSGLQDQADAGSTKVQFYPKKNRITSILSKIGKFFINLLKNIFVYPFSIKKLAQRSKNKIKILFISIPYLLIWIVFVIFVNSSGIYLAYNIIRSQFLAYPSYEAVYPAEGEYWDDYTRPIEIEFHIPVNQEKLQINMAPEDNVGRWEFEKSFSFLPFSRTLKYYPEETIFPGEDIMIYLTDLSNHFYTMSGGEHLIRFNSIYLPEITSGVPEDGQRDAPVDQEFIFNLNQKDGKYVEWDFKFNKKLKFEVIRDFDKTIKLNFVNNLSQGTDYKLEIYQTPLSYETETGQITKCGEKVKVKTINFTTVKAPLISEISPEGTTVLTNEKVRIKFDNTMHKQSVETAFSIEPKVEGKISWDDDKTFSFTPNAPFSKETHYEITFKKGMRSSKGGITESKITHSFDTIGAVKVIGWSPGNGTSVASNVNVTFDQQVDHTSAQSKFSISPNISGAFSWSGNTLIYNPSANFGYSTTYIITIASGVKTVNGLDSRQAFSYSFTTESNIVTLNVPLYRQTHPFTCNVTAIAMALAYKGVGASEMSVYSGIAKDNTACQKSGDTITYWGNPNVGYVGDINGGGTCGGYGVHWGPASAYISSRGVSNQVRSGWNVVGLAQEVEKGNPVVIWWQNGWASPTWKSWNSPSGTVNALNGMHSEVVVGFIGPSSNPSHIITNDPWRGRRTLTVGSFNAMWGYFNRTGIVLY